MPMRGPVLLSFAYPLLVSVQVWPAESVTVKLSVPLGPSRQNATRRWPGWVTMFTVRDVSVFKRSILFWTCTTASGEPPPPVPFPESMTLCGLPWALSVIESEPVYATADVGVNVTLKVQLAPTATDDPQLFVWANPLLMATAEMFTAALPVFLSVTVCAALAVETV